SLASGTTGGSHFEDLERTHVCRNRNCTRDFPEHRGLAISLRARRFEKEFFLHMNDFSELEEELRKLRPARPSADLIARVERALTEEMSVSTTGVVSQERRFHFNWFSLGLGLAAATVLLMFAFIRL